MLRIPTILVLAPVLMSLALASLLISTTPQLSPTACAAPPGVQHITLKGKFLVPEEGGELVFSAGGKDHAIDPRRVRLQKHSVKLLKEISPGTELLVFAKFTPWADGDEFERMACLVAGEHLVPEHVPTSDNLPTWHRGPLRFNENNTIAYVDDATLPTGVDRPTCVVEAAKIADFFETKKGGKQKALPAFVRGTYAEVERDGKKVKVFEPRVITLPTRGIPSKEYQYILDPSRMYRDLSG